MPTPFSWSSSTSRSSALRKSCISAPTSLCGRFQFSLENANSVSASTPRRRQNSTAARTAFWPSRWPRLRGRRRRSAQRPLPSMTIAMWRGMRGADSASIELHRHQLVFLELDDAVDVLDELVGELLDIVFGARVLVLGDLLFLEELLDVMERVATHVAHGDLRVLAFVRDVLGKLLAALLRQRRQVDADHVADRRRREAEIGGEDRLLDRADHGLLIRRDRDRARVGDRDVRDLHHRRVVAVVAHLERLDQRGRRAAGAKALQLVLERIDALLHARLRVLLDVVDVLHGAATISAVRVAGEYSSGVAGGGPADRVG